MSTNYYLLTKPACDHCDRGPDRGLHIGKSSQGWRFGLHVYPSGEHDGEPAPRDLEGWRLLFPQGIVDEYGAPISPDDMLDIITNRPNQPFLRYHPVDGKYCIGAGEGPYDLMVGNFS